MSASIHKLLNTIKSGIARPNRYLVYIIPPLGLASLFPMIEDMGILCESAELPGKQFATLEDKQLGPFRRMPYLSIYNDLTFTFIADDKMKPRVFFDTWQKYVIDSGDQLTSQPQNISEKRGYIPYLINYYDNYIGTVNITVLAESGKPIYNIRCKECYPYDVVSTPISYAETDTYFKIDVKMIYRDWHFI